MTITCSPFRLVRFHTTALLVVFVVSLATPIAAFEFLDFYKWEPGLNNSTTHFADKEFPPMSPGGASWSAMPSGISFTNEVKDYEESPFGPHPRGAVTTDIEFLITSEVDGLEYDLFNQAFNTWAAAAGITNLGQVADGEALIGAPDEDNGHIGDIRVAGLPFETTELAHGFVPCTFTLCLPNGGDGSIGGDIHFNTNRIWLDDPNDTSAGNDFDFFSVALHEIGHALGLGHSDVEESVMFTPYQGARRTLHADDIAGIQALYGPPVIIPEPGSLALILLSMSGLLCRRSTYKRQTG